VALVETKLTKIMSSPVITLHTTDPFSDVEKKFQRYNIRHLPVVDAQKKVVGLVTERDFYRTVTFRKASERGQVVFSQLDDYILEHVMTKNIRTLRDSDSVQNVVKIMATTKYGCLPIVNDRDRLVGIITHIDVLCFFYRNI